MRFTFLAIAVILSAYSYVQTGIPVDNLLADFENLSVAHSAADAKKINKNTAATTLFRQKAQAQIKELYNQSQSKSGLLLMMALPDEYDRNQIDFTKLNLERDKVLDGKMKDADAMFFHDYDTYQRTINNVIDSIYKTPDPSAAADAVLNAYNKQLSWLQKRTPDFYQDAIRYCQQKKYNDALANHNTGHPYYIQLLEMQAVIIDRMMMVSGQVEAGNGFAAALLTIQ